MYKKDNMKEFEWKEVEKFLSSNLETKFNYRNPRLNGSRSCLMCSFFEQKDLDNFSKVSMEGFEALNKDSKVIAIIKDPPFKQIRAIHKGCFESGEQILKNMRIFESNPPSK